MPALRGNVFGLFRRARAMRSLIGPPMRSLIGPCGLTRILIGSVYFFQSSDD